MAVIDTGIDYTHPDLAANYAGGIDYVTPDGDPMDDHGHGTHVSGTIAAAHEQPDGRPSRGRRRRRRRPVRSNTSPTRCATRTGTAATSPFSRRLLQAVADGAKVINMSLGGA